jgi:hypothetical protein
MASIFLSHSSLDKDFVRRLAEDLIELGHDPWLDEWEIGVGQVITEEIQRGVAESDYVVIVLSKHATNSNWVEREWQPKYWEEVRDKKVLIFPVLLEKCEIPTLLAGRRYADFRKSYAVGLVALANALGKHRQPEKEDLSEVLCFVMENLLPRWERAHLEQLESDPNSKPQSRYFKDELYSLVGKGYAIEKGGKSIGKMGPDDHLGDFLELTDQGANFLAWRRKLLSQR